LKQPATTESITLNNLQVHKTPQIPRKMRGSRV